MKKLLFGTFAVCLIAFAALAQQYVPPSTGGGGGSIPACAGLPGNTSGMYNTLCSPSDGTTGAYVCVNTANCTVAADWGIAYPRPDQYSGLQFWFRADCSTVAPCTNPANGASLSSWYNGYGSSNISVAAGAAPVYATAQVNGLPAWNITNCRCTTSQNLAGSITAYALLNPNTLVSGTIVGASTAGGFVWYVTTSGLQKVDKQATTAAGTGTNPVTSGTWHILDVAITSGSGTPSFRLDRAVDTTQSGATVTFTTAGLFLGDYGNDTNMQNALEVEVFGYNVVQGTSTRQALENYLHMRCGC